MSMISSDHAIWAIALINYWITHALGFISMRVLWVYPLMVLCTFPWCCMILTQHCIFITMKIYTCSQMSMHKSYIVFLVSWTIYSQIFNMPTTVVIPDVTVFPNLYLRHVNTCKYNILFMDIMSGCYTHLL